MNKIFTNLSRYSFFLLMVGLTVTGCKDDESFTPSDGELVKNEDATVPLAWMDLFLEIDHYTTSFRPVSAARALAYINLAAYESLMMGMPDYRSLETEYPGLKLPDSENKQYHYPTVVNAVYANLFKRLIPSGYILPDHQSRLQFDILKLENDFDETFRQQAKNDVFARSKDYGNAVADAVYKWSKTDPVGHDGHLNARPDGYTPPQGPGLWQPTPPDFSTAYYPYWGNARTLAISASERLARAPLTYSENPLSPFYAQAIEVRNAVNSLDFEGEWIAEFWSDDYVDLTFSPGARWIAVASQVIQAEGNDLETAVLTLAKVSIALNDAGVAAWYSKYVYNVERPITFIQRLIEPNWQSHLPITPSFPAYPSGHATFGAAAAEVLSHLFGYDYGMTDFSHDGRNDFYGMPRSFTTFYQMAEENAYSRIVGGVHFRMDSEEGLRLGYQVGRKVNVMPFK